MAARRIFLRRLCAARRDPDSRVVGISPQTLQGRGRYCLADAAARQVQPFDFSQGWLARARLAGGATRVDSPNSRRDNGANVDIRLVPYNGMMIHEILAVGPLQCNCSVIGDESTGEAMVIDPGDDIENVLAIIGRHKLQVRQIVITHAHIDHVGGAMKLRAATGAPILLNQNDYTLLKMLDVQAAWIGVAAPSEVKIDQSIGQGDIVSTGSLQANVLHTPGHTEGSICLYFFAEQKLIAGDTLFAGSIGRTDLPGGSMQKILRSLHSTVLALPDETVVVPGHGPLTTIGEEREGNPFLVKS